MSGVRLGGRESDLTIPECGLAIMHVASINHDSCVVCARQIQHACADYRISISFTFYSRYTIDRLVDRPPPPPPRPPLSRVPPVLSMLGLALGVR